MIEYDLINIDKIHTYVRGKAFEDAVIDLDRVETKVFSSWDIKFLEKQINEFLNDYIYVHHMCNRYEYDTTKYPQFTTEKKLYKYVAVVYYMDYPF